MPRACLPAVIGLVTIGECPAGSVRQALEAAGFSVRRLSGDAETWSADVLEGVSLFVVCGPASPEMYQLLRRHSPAGILALVPGGDEAAVLRALSAGADDSQSLSIGERELAARAGALLRRAGRARHRRCEAR